MVTATLPLEFDKIKDKVKLLAEEASNENNATSDELSYYVRPKTSHISFELWPTLYFAMLVSIAVMIIMMAANQGASQGASFAWVVATVVGIFLVLGLILAFHLHALLTAHAASKSSAIFERNATWLAKNLNMADYTAFNLLQGQSVKGKGGYHYLLHIENRVSTLYCDKAGYAPLVIRLGKDFNSVLSDKDAL